MNYRLCTNEQHSEIIKVFSATFSDSDGEKEGATIGELVKNLLSTADESNRFCFIAQDDDQIVGAIIFCQMQFDTSVNEQNYNSYILSPVAVSPAYQKQGVGSALINYGISKLKAQGVTLLFTYGDPSYYGRFGFEQITEQQIQAPQPLTFPHGWLAKSLTAEGIPNINGKSQCTAALNKARYW